MTERVRLGALVTPVTYRAPALLVKTIATLDALSGSRAVLGAGWIADEHYAYGLDFPATAERQNRLEVAVQVCLAMLDDAATGTFAGRYYQIDGAVNVPQPVNGRVPILIGGSGERRTLQAVARFAGCLWVIGRLLVVRRICRTQACRNRWGCTGAGSPARP